MWDRLQTQCPRTEMMIAGLSATCKPEVSETRSVDGTG